MIINRANLDTLFAAFNASFSEGFGQAPKDHERITMMVSSMTSKEVYAWLGQWPGLKEWVGERTLEGIAQHGYALENRKFESSVRVKRDNIEDDEYGVYAPMFREAGYAAAAHPCEMVYAALKAGFAKTCYDGQYFFDTDHPAGDGVQSNTAAGAGTPWYLLATKRMLKPIIFQTRRGYNLTRLDGPDDETVFMRDEYLYGVDARVEAGYGLWQLAFGSRAALDADGYSAAREAMLSFKGDEGRPLGIVPDLLVVPPSLEQNGRKLLTSELAPGGETNEWRGTADLHVSPWLA